MNDLEYRSVIEYHAEQMVNLTVEPQPGYGLPKKETILKRIARMKELAENLE